MGITKRPAVTSPAPATEKAVETFIQGAPDAKPQSRSLDTEVSEQITIRIPKAILDRATKMAAKQGIPRASYIKRALTLQLIEDERKE